MTHHELAFFWIKAYALEATLTKYLNKLTKMLRSLLGMNTNVKEIDRGGTHTPPYQGKRERENTSKRERERKTRRREKKEAKHPMP